MRKLFALLVLMLIIQELKAQDTLRIKSKMYRTVVSGLNTGNSTSGYFGSISDSSIYISPVPVFSREVVKERDYLKLDYQNIGLVKFKKRRAIGSGILYGAIIGVGVGAIAGAVSYKKPSDDIGIVIDFLTGGRTGSVLAGGVIGGVLGCIAGAIVGALAKKTFIIGGNKEKFQTMKSKIIF